MCPARKSGPSLCGSDCGERRPVRCHRVEGARGRWDITRQGDQIVVGTPNGEPDASVTSDAHDFVRWGTARIPWTQACEVTGDAAVATAFFDQLNIV